jgi:hypothetical protein
MMRLPAKGLEAMMKRTLGGRVGQIANGLKNVTARFKQGLSNMTTPFLSNAAKARKAWGNGVLRQGSKILAPSRPKRGPRLSQPLTSISNRENASIVRGNLRKTGNHQSNYSYLREKAWTPEAITRLTGIPDEDVGRTLRR